MNSLLINRTADNRHLPIPHAPNYFNTLILFRVASTLPAASLIRDLVENILTTLKI